jgi:hypothetical protein
MIGHGHVGGSDFRQILVSAGSTVKLLDPIGRDVWVRVSTNLAQQLGQGTGLFLAYKQRETTRAQRIQIIAEEKLFPLGRNQALWCRNQNQASAYVWVEFWNQEPPEAGS